MQHILTLHNVTKRFGGLLAVNDASFDVPAEGVTAVIGPNGAGKTTLFNLISGFMSPSGGRIVFLGADITSRPPEAIAAHGLVRTFQLAKPFGDLTALENVKVGQHTHTKAGLWAALLRTQAARREEQAVTVKAQAWLAMVGLSRQANTRAGALPYGQLRLLEVARALAAEPKLLLLDEPAAGLNGEETLALAQLIRRIAQAGTAVLLIEHDMNLVMNTADQIMVFDFGRRIAAGSPREIKQDKAVIAAYLGEPSQNDAVVGGGHA